MLRVLVLDKTHFAKKETKQDSGKTEKFLDERSEQWQLGDKEQLMKNSRKTKVRFLAPQSDDWKRKKT